MEMQVNNDNDKTLLYEHLKNRKLPYHVKVDDGRDKRSNKQNSYYYGVIVTMIMNHTGWFKHEVEDMLRHKFLLYARFFNDKVYSYPGHTSDLDTKQMEILCEQIRVWALTDLDLRIPLPNEPVDQNDEPIAYER